jgi:hypothetical protein
MSLKVLVISEDQSDWHILGPIIGRMFRELGKPNANVRPCLEPRIAGVNNALKWETILEIIRLNPFVDIFLLIVDRDGKPSRSAAIRAVE